MSRYLHLHLIMPKAEQTAYVQKIAEYVNCILNDGEEGCVKCATKDVTAVVALSRPDKIEIFFLCAGHQPQWMIEKQEESPEAFFVDGKPVKGEA